MPDEQDLQPEGEEIQAETSEEPEVQEEVDPLEEIKREVAELKGSNETLNEKVKDLGGRLTREQQEKAELLKFHKSTIPKINKSFEEQWEESPERAVEDRILQKTEGTQQQMAYLNAMNWINGAVQENPELAKYRQKVIDMGTNEHGSLTFSEGGIRALFQLAKTEDLEKEYSKVQEAKKTSSEKERAFTESSNAKPPQTVGPKATAEERRIADQLGIKIEDYLKQKNTQRTVDRGNN